MNRDLKVFLTMATLCVLLAICGWWLPGCSKLGNVGIFTMQASVLSDEVLDLEDAVLQASESLTPDEQAVIRMSVQSIKLIAQEARRFETVEDYTKLDLSNMNRQYERVKDDLLTIKEHIYDRKEVWATIPLADRRALTDFWDKAADLSKEIDDFKDDPDTAHALQVAAKITAYGTLATKILIKVAPAILESI